eukprot:CAMPEP_0119526784 /NCGR_PEP_ID=MMETSP1344-20130328/41330_1 /TAXON_ID=236787 /ORGANISM="Florenciella parvula, Strain CCMP2471" /LENGTH=81 /DNA_ID=CAMNT_0007565853 /DNA_START=141 /DNA_END=383 /DNA_ORIENTATION=-
MVRVVASNDISGLRSSSYSRFVTFILYGSSSSSSSPGSALTTMTDDCCFVCRWLRRTTAAVRSGRIGTNPDAEISNMHALH